MRSMAGEYSKRKKVIWTLAVIVLLLVIGSGIYILYGMLSEPTPEEIMEEIVRENSDAVISVGIWQDGREDKYLYTSHGREEFIPYTYQIGSITKTFTGAMIAYEEAKGNLGMEDGIPSFDLIVTHKSGLADLWEREMMKHPGRSFHREDVYALAEQADREEGTFEYSNFGSALAGSRATEIYGRDKMLEDVSYQEAMNHFIMNELGLEETRVGGPGDFKDNYIWEDRDEMMAAGAMTSNVSDLITYGRRYLSEEEKYSYLKRAVEGRSEVDSSYDIGMFWIIDKKSGLIWHNGEISMEGENGKEVGSQCFIGISPKDNKVVVVLSNCICNADDETAYSDILGYLMMKG